MKKITLLFIAFQCFIVTSQTKEERKQIIKNYDIEAIKELETRIKNKNKKVEERINTYLKNNSSAERVFTSGNKNYYLDDIIDGKPIYITTDNVNSAKATRTNFLHNGGALGLNLEGQNMIIGIWDEGVARVTHYDFRESASSTTSRVTTPDQTGTNYNSHGTHVAGTMVGRGHQSNAKGMAPQAELVSYDWINDYVEVLNQASFGGLLISNQSYGIPVRDPQTNQQNAPSWMMGCYNSDAADWDDLAYDAPYYLQVLSAGNDGESTYTGGMLAGFDKLTAEKNGKNNLVVANANNPFALSSGAIISLAINPSSSQGPSDDGRIKPDIAGDGTDVYSAESGNDSAYGIKTGTSMSSPNVAGSLLLLQQYYNELNSQFMRSATLKGLVCHTATDDGTRIGPDPILGWGLLNSKFAAETIFNASTGNAHISERTLSNGATYTTTVEVTSGEPLSATLCWTDPSGTPRDGQLNSPTPALINDLDLRITAPNGSTTYFPWKLDLNDISGSAITGDNLVDNVEKIDIDNPTSGIYTLTVTHKGALTNGTQNFSLIVTGSSLTLGTPNLEILSLNIWPNPAHTEINFEYQAYENTTKVVLIDLLGRTVYKDVRSNSTGVTRGKIDTSALARGVYILKINQGNASTQKKVILK